MTNDSSTGGYLLPNPTAVPVSLQDADLDNFFQQVFAGLTGIDGSLVRPSWQQVPPNQPDIDTAWMAFGITEQPADTYAYEIHNPENNGSDYLSRNEQLDILCSFYGPTARSNAAIVRDGLQVSQNREVLMLGGIALISCGTIRRVPTIYNARQYLRVDMMVYFRRQIVRTYPILHITTAGIVLETDNTPQIIENINISD